MVNVLNMLFLIILLFITFTSFSCMLSSHNDKNGVKYLIAFCVSAPITVIQLFITVANLLNI